MPILTQEGETYTFRCGAEYANIARVAGMEWYAKTKCAWSTSNPLCACLLIKYADQSTKAHLTPYLEERKTLLALSRATSSDTPYPHPEGLEYKSFQIAGVDYIRRAYNVLLADEMGLGKTIQSIGYMNYAEPKRTIIICPATLKVNWLQELEKWLVTKRVIAVINDNKGIPDAGVVIINYDRLKKNLEYLSSVDWDLMLADECFHYGTIVQTSEGPMLIGDIVDHKKKVYVLSFNSSTNVMEYKLVTSWYSHALENKSFVRIVHSSGTLVCTGNHKIFVENRGYVEAQSIHSGDRVRILSPETHYQKKGEVNGSILLEVVHIKRQLEQGIISHQDSSKHAEERGERVRTVLKYIRVCSEFAKQILRLLLRGKVENRSTRVERSPVSAHEGTHTLEQGKEKSGRKRTNDSTEQRSGAPKETNGRIHEVEKSEPDVYPPRRQANDNESATSIIRRAWRRIRYGARHSCGGITILADITTDILLSGPSECRTEARHRGGRQNAPDTETEGMRQAQAKSLDTSRVDRVEVLEPGDTGRHELCPWPNRIYDIEVTGNHNYIANGVLVSNSHAVKSKKSQRCRALLKIEAKKTIFITGTPILNRPSELWTSLRRLDPDSWNNWMHFATRYCAARKERGNRIVADGASNKKELGKKLRSSIMIRRLKSEVMKDLPPKIRQIIEMPCANVDLLASELVTYEKFEDARRRLKALVDGAKMIEDNAEYQKSVADLRQAIKVHFSELSRVRKEVAIYKAPSVVAYLKSSIDAGKIVCFAHHKEVISTIENEIPNSVTLSGKTKPAYRIENVRRFQEDPRVRLFIGSIKAAGVGITLTKSSHVVMSEGSWTPSDVSQCEDRCHRIGQTDSVLVQHLVLEGSLDAKMMKMCVEKQNVIDGILQ